MEERFMNELDTAVLKEDQAKIEQLLDENKIPLPAPDGKHLIYYESPAGTTNTLPAAVCTCGAQKFHVRPKVLFEWAKKHKARTGHSLAVKDEAAI